MTTVTGIIAQKSSFWKLENGLEIFDNFLKKLPEFEVPGMLQSGMVQSAAEFVLSFIPGLPKYLIRPLFHLVQKNSDVRNFCSTISTELKQIIATWKTNGDFKIAIVGLVESVLRSQPDSAERLAILREIGQVLDQHADKRVQEKRLSPTDKACNRKYSSVYSTRRRKERVCKMDFGLDPSADI